MHLDLPLLLLENMTEKRQHRVKQISWLNLQVQEQSIFFCDFKQSSYYFKYHCHVSFQAMFRIFHVCQAVSKYFPSLCKEKASLAKTDFCCNPAAHLSEQKASFWYCFILEHKYLQFRQDNMTSYPN